MMQCMRTSGKCRHWSIWILTLASTSVLLIAACHKVVAPAPPDIAIEHEITPQPVRVGPATIKLKLTDPYGKAVTGARIKLEGNMSHAGMAPAFAEADEIEPGLYRAPLELSMGGDWIVLVHLTLSDGQKVERQFDIRVCERNEEPV
jgi:hypothetical protein